MSTPPFNLYDYIRDVPDFPKPGIVFKDITPLLKSPEAYRFALDSMADFIRPHQPTHIAAIESRGFVFAGGICERLEVGFIPLRKSGKLPGKTHSAVYQLEYGTDSLEIHQDATKVLDRVVLVDDLLATGGTATAAVNLIRQTGAEVVAACFALELCFLEGRKNLHGIEVYSLLPVAD
jgi:adenine phosphoribosyltransferase